MVRASSWTQGDSTRLAGVAASGLAGRGQQQHERCDAAGAHDVALARIAQRQQPASLAQQVSARAGVKSGVWAPHWL